MSQLYFRVSYYLCVKERYFQTRLPHIPSARLSARYTPVLDSRRATLILLYFLLLVGPILHRGLLRSGPNGGVNTIGACAAASRLWNAAFLRQSVFCVVLFTISLLVLSCCWLSLVTPFPPPPRSRMGYRVRDTFLYCIVYIHSV